MLCLAITTVTCQGPAPTAPPTLIPISSAELTPHTSQLTYHHGQPFTGKSYRDYPDGTPAETMQYSQGLKNGLWKKWHENGQLSYQAPYQDGLRNGEVKTWYNDGTLQAHGHFVNGAAHGSHRQWYKDGSRHIAAHYDMGSEVGLQQAWLQNGKIYNNYEAINGEVYGLKRSELCYSLTDEMLQLTH